MGFDQPGGTVHADNQTACDFGVKRAAMARFVHTQDALDPRHHFVRGRVGWLVKVNETRPGEEFKEEIQIMQREVMVYFISTSTQSQGKAFFFFFTSAIS